MRVTAVLAALPRYGPVRARSALSALGISPARRLRGLGSVQRADLLALTAKATSVGPASATRPRRTPP